MIFKPIIFRGLISIFFYWIKLSSYQISEVSKNFKKVAMSLFEVDNILDNILEELIFISKKNNYSHQTLFLCFLPKISKQYFNVETQASLLVWNLIRFNNNFHQLTFRFHLKWVADRNEEKRRLEITHLKQNCTEAIKLTTQDQKLSLIYFSSSKIFCFTVKSGFRWTYSNKCEAFLS